MIVEQRWPSQRAKKSMFLPLEPKVQLKYLCLGISIK